MIYGLIHPGSGLGNQLFRYVATRVLSLDKGYDFSMVGRDYFKGSSFMDIYFGKPCRVAGYIEDITGKISVKGIQLWEEKTNYYNPEFNFIEDNTSVDGEFQSSQYWGHRMKEIDGWLKVEPIDIPDDVCVVGFRGGEYALFPELFLTKEYWTEAKILMLQKNIHMKFEIHTDDPKTAKEFLSQIFPDAKIIQDIGINWRSMRCTKYAIIANSSFYILPRLLNGGFTIAPRFWARRNTKEWSRPDNFYSNFSYI